MIVDDLFEIGGTGQAGKIKKVAGNKITIQHDDNPGIETTVDVSKMDIDTSDPTGAKVSPKNSGPQNSNNKLKPGQKITIATEETLDEGVNDPAIFKAVFMAGGPGSGKTFAVDNLALQSLGFKNINSDSAYEAFMAKAGMETTPENIMSDEGQAIRAKAKSVTQLKQALANNGKLGVVIDGTGRDYEKTQAKVAELRELGYDCAMVFVNTDLETAQARNAKRMRSLPEEMVTKMWQEVQKNIGKFHNLFGKNMYVLDNSDGANIEGGIQGIYRRMKEFAEAPPKHPIAKAWIKAQVDTKNQ
jgi:predicted kinase